MEKPTYRYYREDHRAHHKRMAYTIAYRYRTDAIAGRARNPDLVIDHFEIRVAKAAFKSLMGNRRRIIVLLADHSAARTNEQYEKSDRVFLQFARKEVVNG